MRILMLLMKQPFLSNIRSNRILFGVSILKILNHKIKLTQDGKRYIIENVVVLECSSVQNEIEDSAMPNEIITIDEIQKIYEQIGITETTQQISQSTELNSTNNPPVPTLYSQVSLVYRDSVTL